MEWIKKIIEKHTKEDGTIDMESAMKDINTEFPKNAVPKETYNDVSGQLKTANATIKTLKDNNADSESLQKTIKDHEITIEKLQSDAKEELETLKFNHALENALNKAGSKSVKATKALLDMNSLKGSKNVDSDVETQIKALRESDPYLFNDVDPGGTGGSKGNGSKSGKPPVNNPWSKESFNLTEQGKLLKEQPELAKQYQASAKK